MPTLSKYIMIQICTDLASYIYVYYISAISMYKLKNILK